MATRRTVAGTVVTMATPAIVNGRPTVPAHWARLDSTSTARQGGTHIHVVARPGADDTGAAPAHPWTARWSADDLPDPAGGYYWLGDASAADGTANINAAARQWNPDSRSSNGMPAWRSRYPFKPSVTAVSHYLPGGGTVHHPAGVNFNSHYIEHMWTHLPGLVAQPFTFLIAGMVTSWPHGAYTHPLLDTGVDPASESVHYTTGDCNTARRMKDATANRAFLHVTPDQLLMGAHPGGKTMRAPVASRLAPCLFIGVFDGAKSQAGVYRPGYRRLRTGKLETDGAYRFLLGRSRGWLSQDRSGHLLVFEIRFFDHALSADQLDTQYDHLSTVHQFHKYRNG